MDGALPRSVESRLERFDVDGTMLEATLYLPSRREGRVPAVVMGNGFGTVRDFGLVPAAAAIASRGVAVLLFDYRYFGGSGGEPRQLVDVEAQLADFRAAVAHARSLPEVDPARLGLSGTSYGGGHALVVAADDPSIRAVVAKVPHCDTRAAFRTARLGDVARNMGVAIRDAIGAKLGRPVRTIPLVGEPGEVAVMTHPGWRARYLGLVPEGARWSPAIPARSLLAVGDYRPITQASRIGCPVLVVYSAQDRGIPAESVEATIAELRRVEVETFDGDHFDVYDGPEAQRLREREARFFAERLGA